MYMCVCALVKELKGPLRGDVMRLKFSKIYYYIHFELMFWGLAFGGCAQKRPTITQKRPAITQKRPAGFWGDVMGWVD